MIASRIYIIDNNVPEKSSLIGYINFPYTIEFMDFAYNCLYLSTTDSIIYQYDLSKLLPERVVSDPSETENGQSGQVEENIPPGDPTSEEPEGDAEEPALPEDSSQEEITDDGENHEEKEKIKSIYKAYWPLLSLIPSQPMMYSYWPWLSYSKSDNLLPYSDTQLPYLNNSLSSPENTLLYGESTLPYSNTSLPYYIPGKPSPGYYPLLLPCSESSLKNSWYLPALPFSYVDYLLSPDFGLNINLPADYPRELLPDLLYLFGIKVERPSD